MKLSAESEYFINLALFYFPVPSHFISGVMYLMVNLDEHVSALLPHRLDWSCALGELGTLADVCMGA